MNFYNLICKLLYDFCAYASLKVKFKGWTFLLTFFFYLFVFFIHTFSYKFIKFIK